MESHDPQNPFKNLDLDNLNYKLQRDKTTFLDKTILTGVFYASSSQLYGAPGSFCFDIECDDNPIQDNPNLENYNLNERLEAFMNYLIQMVKNSGLSKTGRWCRLGELKKPTTNLKSLSNFTGKKNLFI